MQLLQNLASRLSLRFGKKTERTEPLLEGSRSSPLIKRLNAYRIKGWSLALVYFDFVQFHQFEQVYGNRAAEAELGRLTRLLESLDLPTLPDARVLAVQNVWGDDFFLYLASHSPCRGESLVELAGALRSQVESLINPSHLVARRGRLDVHVGAASLDGNPTEALGSLMYRAAKQAQALAKGQLQSEDLAQHETFMALLQGPGLTSVYQPVVDLRMGQVLGWESLMRGPADTPLASPSALLSYAEQHGHVWALDRAASLAALRGAQELPDAAKLFLNVHPKSFADPQFRTDYLQELIASQGLRPENIVFEITERTCIDDFPAFRRMLQHYREFGYLVAVDDVGAGYSGLQSIAELRPDYLKIDMSLIRGCNADLVKQAMLEAVVTLASKIGGQVIAEGVETREELHTLIRLGVHYGQGYYLARPSYPPPSLPLGIARELARGNALSRGGWVSASPIEVLLQTAPVVQPTTPTRDLVPLFENPYVDGVVVCDGDRPIGLVMQSRFYRRLGVPFGIPLYYGRPVTYAMDTHPLIVELTMPLDLVTNLAVHRDQSRRYDLAIVTDQGRYCGAVSVHQLLNAMAEKRVGEARHVNPLSGLPGNQTIREVLAGRQVSGQAFSVLYADLTAFKVYNDTYGFEQGDVVLSFLARLLRRAVAKQGNRMDFLGHVGGDDFILLTTPDRVAAVGSYLNRVWDRVAPQFYAASDRAQGGLAGFDRQGQPTLVPMMGLSLAVVDCLANDSAGFDHLSGYVALLKRKAKMAEGSHMVRASLHETHTKT